MVDRQTCRQNTDTLTIDSVYVCVYTHTHTHKSEIGTNQFEQLLGARHLSDGQIILEGKIKKQAGDLGENQKSVVLQIKRWKFRKL